MTRDCAGSRALELAVDALAVYRLTRLVTADTITQGWRDRIISRAYHRGTPLERETWQNARTDMLDGDCRAFQDLAVHDLCAPKLAALVTCRWCAGFYVAAIATTARYSARRPWELISRAFALSAVGALIARLESD